MGAVPREWGALTCGLWFVKWMSVMLRGEVRVLGLRILVTSRPHGSKGPGLLSYQGGVYQASTYKGVQQPGPDLTVEIASDRAPRG